ncbi:CPBP family glutamic-type intramembrane protease [Lapidilactobacillus wuchangensis]|uniref:CPBP family glutamic-type intramembrane protease n=1 Tax=Lapidilactobacillus wuchangensis TaxID=2486001 RepID=UPI001CDCF102|nr:CPBP family glutamic-type intramembrane protease [Lapidilactobacillus wuchangensis]
MAAVLMIIGYCSLMLFEWAWWGILVSGIFAWLIAFNPSGKAAFSRPEHVWLIPLGVILYFGVSMIVGAWANAVGLKWAGSPAAAQPLFPMLAQLPFMLMGEELLGIGVLEGARARGWSWLPSTLLSGLIFGMLHFLDYWDGSVASTMLHVLMLQGVARLILNRIYLHSGQSIWSSWLAHVLIDLLAFAI